MKNKFVASLLLCFSLAVAVAQDSPGKKILPYPISQHKLDNGLNVVTVPYNSPGLASLYIVVRAGSRDETEKGKTGFAHFFEHMMFRGTDKYSKEEYGDIMKAMGASANANTSLDRTMYYMTGNADMLDKMFEIEADRFQHLKYSEHDFKTEAGAVKGEYTKNSASPYQQLYEKVAGTAFNKHTYAHTTMGFFEDVVDMPNQYDYSLTFFDRFYRPEYTTILVVGDVTPERVNKLAEQYFGMWEHGNYKPEIPVEPKQTKTRYAHVKQENFPPYLSLNFKGPAFSDKDKDLPALSILTTILFAENSDLYRKLVVDEQKARFIGGGPQFSRDPNLISVSASLLDVKDMQYVKDELMKALEEAKTKPMDAQKIEDTKSRIKYSFAMSMDSPDAIANALGRFIWLTGNPESLNNIYSVYDTITAQDLMAAAKKYFKPETMTVGTIAPTDNPPVK
ncbi:insulinase family protein [Pontibacter sp. 172403-2]|uniref:M16 family metallopeptidase n=1 Tax=Pontibacter rufus TaxID=2791028 RepID=UPI0018AF617E|nr:pitrilysin family protein [Pontibacter sp. 172403-2]MBF9253937.1 insulinase family protein [Pontibacter sp. 172403-2]